jgi:hypothetical protein
LSVLPGDITIKRAELTLFFAGGTDGGEACSLFVAATGWNVSEVTWTHARTDKKWESDSGGGDYNLDVFSRAVYALPESWEKYDATAFVKDFYNNPDSNLGFIISTERGEFGNPERSYISSDYTDIDYLRPKLTIEYEDDNAISFSGISMVSGRYITIKQSHSLLQLYIPFEKPYVGIVTDMLGRTVYSFKGDSPGTRAYTRPLHTGIYFLNLQVGEEEATSKLFIRK